MVSTWNARINPALHRFPNEAAVLGRIVLAFGELEYMLIHCASQALKDDFHFLKAMYRLRSTTSRIQATDVFLRTTYRSYGIEREYSTMLSALKHCQSIRNQYSHCNWGDDHEAGLFFADLEESAEAAVGFVHHWNHVDLPILEAQEEYFVYTQSWLYWLEYELRVKREEISDNLFPKPPAQDRPLLHNPRSQHIPPWLTEDLKAQHLARALESEQSAPQSERPPSVLRLTREEWAAKDAKDAREASKLE
jgi:hypothetical protein